YCRLELCAIHQRNSHSTLVLLQSSLQLAERDKFRALEFLDPALADLVDRHRIEIVQLFAAVPERGDEVCLLEDSKMLGHGLPRHGQPLAQLVQGLAASHVK